MSLLYWCIMYILYLKCRVWSVRNETAIREKAFYAREREKYLASLYFPNYGYEPYWDESAKRQSQAEAEKAKYTLAGITTTEKHEACGEECSYLYIRMGKVCAHQVRDLGLQVDCWMPQWHEFRETCNGYPHSLLTGYRTFDNYCLLLDAQCAASTPATRFAFTHMGACKNESVYWPDVYNSSAPAERVKTFNKSIQWIVDGWPNQWDDEYAADKKLADDKAAAAGGDDP